MGPEPSLEPPLEPVGDAVRGPDGQAVFGPRIARLYGLSAAGLVRGRALAARVPVPPTWALLAALIVANWAIAYKVAHIAVHNGWLYYNGGDSTWYYTSASILGNGHIPQATIGYGYSLLLAPIAYFAGPNALAGLPAVVLFNQLILAPVVIGCIYGITRMLGGRGFAFVASIAWVIFPVAVIHYFLADYHSRYVTVTLPSALGLTSLGDYPSMVFVLVSAYFLLRFLESGRSIDAVSSGLAAGFAIAVKPANLIFLAAPVLAYLVARKPVALALFAGGMAPSLLGLVLWKYRGLGYLPAFSNHASPVLPTPGSRSLLAATTSTSRLHHYVPLDWSRLHHNYDGLREYTWSQRMITWTAVAGLVGLARRQLVAAVLVSVWLVAYFVVKGSSDVIDIVSGNFLTHLIPMFPAYFLLVVSCVFLLPVFGRRKVAPLAESGSLFGGRLRHVPVGVLAAISVIGLLSTGLLPPLKSAAAADVGAAGIYVTSNGFALQATRTSASSVTLTWPKQSTSGMDSSYAITRDAADSVQCTPVSGAASSCSFAGTQVGSVAGDSHSWTDSSAQGKWVYRVVLSATPGEPQVSSDYLMISRAASVSP